MYSLSPKLYVIFVELLHWMSPDLFKCRVNIQSFLGIHIKYDKHIINCLSKLLEARLAFLQIIP